jgi:hypothetical protein
VTDSGKISREIYAKGGRIQTIYLGAKSSAVRIKIYDKAKQMQSQSKKTGEPIPEGSLTRFEATLRLKSCSANALANIPNPFTGLNVAHFKILAGDDLLKVFILATRALGGKATLPILNPANRKRCGKWLEEHASWWNPEQLWKEWAMVAKGLMYP